MYFSCDQYLVRVSCGRDIRCFANNTYTYVMHKVNIATFSLKRFKKYPSGLNAVKSVCEDVAPTPRVCCNSLFIALPTGAEFKY